MVYSKKNRHTKKKRGGLKQVGDRYRLQLDDFTKAFALYRNKQYLGFGRAQIYKLTYDEQNNTLTFDFTKSKVGTLGNLFLSEAAKRANKSFGDMFGVQDFNYINSKNIKDCVIKVTLNNEKPVDAQIKFGDQSNVSEQQIDGVTNNGSAFKTVLLQEDINDNDSMAPLFTKNDMNDDDGKKSWSLFSAKTAGYLKQRTKKKARRH